MHYLNTKEAASILNCSPKNITLLCSAGKFPGCKKVPGRKTEEWRIPAEEVIQYQAQKEVEAEILPPEDYALVTRKSLMDLIAEVVSRNESENEEIRKIILESRIWYAEEMKRKDEEIKDLRGRLMKQEEESSEIRNEISAVWGKVSEMKNIHPWWMFWRIKK